MRLRALSSAALAAAILAAPAAFAQDYQGQQYQGMPQYQGYQQEEPERQGMLQACGQDIQTFCSNVTPGQGRIAHCLRPHLRDLSPACKGEIRERHKERMQEREQEQPQE